MAPNTPWVLNALAVFGILSTLLAAKLMISHGPRFLYSLSYTGILLAMLSYGLIYFLHVKNPMTVLVITTIIYQMSRGILEFTPWNVFPFIPDVDHIMTRGDKAGTYAAVMTFFRKSTGALATWLAGVVLEALGYVSTAAKQQPGVTDKVALLFMIAPMILVAVALVVSWGFKLDRQTHKILQNEIKRLEDGGDKKDVAPEALEVAEELTGHPYEELWPVQTYEESHARAKTF